MSVVVSASQTGSGPLVRVRVLPLGRENIAVRGVRAQCLNGGNVVSDTGFALGKNHLLVCDAVATRGFKAAVRDANGLWSEWAQTSVVLTGNYSAGATEASIGSASTSDDQLQSAGVSFPDLSAGSGKILVRRTIVAKSLAFSDETCTPRWSKGVAAFNVTLANLDDVQARLLRRFFRALNGPQTPFFFDFTPPENGTRLTAPSVRYVVRFRDPKVMDKIFDVTYTETSFYLQELLDDPEGGEI